MTTPRGLRATYVELFSVPHAGAIIGWSLLARLPLGMTPLALLLLVRAEGGSYAAAGGVVAAYGVALAAGAPVAGRLVDRRGPRRILRQRAVAYPAFLGVVVVLAALDAPLVVIGLAAACAGASSVPIAPTVRSVLPNVVPDPLRPTVYAVEAALQEVFFVAGPLLAAVLAAADPLAGVTGAAVATALGTGVLLRIDPIATAPPAERRELSLLGALEASGIRLLVVFALCVGLSLGAIEVAAPAFAEQQGSRELGGLVLATFALGSLVGGLVAGARPAADYLRRGLTFAAVYPFVAMALALAWSIPSICVIVFFAGLPFAPMVAGFYGLVDRIAPFGAVAEAFAWLGTAITLGIAFGSAAAGPLIDHVGVKAPFVVGPLAALAGVGLVAGRRGLLRVADA